MVMPGERSLLMVMPGERSLLMVMPRPCFLALQCFQSVFAHGCQDCSLLGIGHDADDVAFVWVESMCQVCSHKKVKIFSTGTDHDVGL